MLLDTASAAKVEAEDTETDKKMLIAIISEGLEPISLVAEKFGRTPFIIIYDTEKNTFESFRNPYLNILGGAGIQTSQFIIEKNVASVITTEIGLNPLRLLKSAGVEVYSCPKKQVKEVVKEFVEGKLPTIQQEPFRNFGRKRGGRKRRNRNKNS